jgi:flagellar biosynthesis protein FlhG
MGKKVVIFDADLGLANVDILLGKKPQYNINHVIEGQKKIEEIIMEVDNGLKIIPASSGIEKLASLSAEKMDEIIEGLKAVERDVDFFIIDTAAGIAPAVLGFLVASSEVFVVTTNEPTAITDAYAVIKTLHRRKQNAQTSVIVNMCRGPEEARVIFDRINGVFRRSFQERSLQFLGAVPRDDNVSLAVRRQVPFVLNYPRSEASGAVRQIARKMLENRTPPESGLDDFFKNIRGLMT